MAQFTCPVCDKGFEQRSRLERHMKTSHPEPAPSAARIASAFEGVDFPASADELKGHVRDEADEETRKTVERFRPGTCRSMADVAEEVRAVLSS